MPPPESCDADPGTLTPSADEHPIRLLLIEDEEHLADALARGLAGEGYAVDVERDGIAGLARAESGQYEAILLDLMLPGYDGRQICERLRASEDWTPVLVITARDAALSEAALLTLGADDYVTKPFAFPVLLARLRAVLRRAGVARPGKIVVGDLVIDPGARTLRRGGTEVELTSREFDVLQRLARSSGRVVGKEELLVDVWGEAFRGDPNIVEVYVRRIRDKIDRPFGVRSVVTVRGIGYRIGPPEPWTP